MAAAELDWIDTLVRLLIAAGLGGALGLEREFDGQDAGFRTHLLVVLGAALFGVVSVGAFDVFVSSRAATNVTVDVTRIAAYVAPGIGFIGGGAILKTNNRVRGITTAATLWSAAAIGVAVGVGFWVGGVIVTVMTLIALQLLQPVSNYVGRLGRRRRSPLLIELAHDVDVAAIIDLVHDKLDSPVGEIRHERTADGSTISVSAVRASERDIDDLIVSLQRRHDVVAATRTANL